MRFHTDTRRTFWGDIFDTPFGDINAVQLHPGVVMAWHRHQHQDDHLFILYGDALIRAIDPTGVLHYWDFKAPLGEPILIPRRWWHGYTSRQGATLIQFNGPGKWDGSDEERHPIDDEMPWT